METKNKDWKPEVGKAAWYFDPNKEKSISAGIIEKLSEEKGVFAYFNAPLAPTGKVVRHISLLYPTAEAALASIKVYGLDGKEVVIPAVGDVFKEIGAAKMLDTYLEALDVVVETFRDYRSGKLSKDEFDAFIDQSIKTSDDMAARTAAFLDYHNAGERMALQKIHDIAYDMEIEPNPEGSARLKAAQERFASLAAGNEDPADPSVREITTPTDRRNGDHC